RGVLNHFVSAPPEKNRPAAVSTMPRTASSSLAWASASARPRRTAKPSPLTGGLSKLTTAMPSRIVVPTAMSMPAPCRGEEVDARRSCGRLRAPGESPAQGRQRRHLRGEAQRLRIGGHAGPRPRAHALQDRGEAEQVVGQAEVPVLAGAQAGAALVVAHVGVLVRNPERGQVQAAEA